MAEVKMILVRFLKRCFINEGGGRTVDPGDQARIPETHFHPELHERLDPPAAEATPTDTP